mgnify:FL=1
MTKPTNAPVWTRTLRAGDIVAFKFPHERKGAEAPKSRPALVLGLQDFAGTLFAELAYGTTQPIRSRAGYGVTVVSREELDTASLHQPTTFNTARRVTVPVTHPGFDVHPQSATPVLGRLTKAKEARLHEMYSKLRAERDSQRSRLFGRRRPRIITVERRVRGKRTVQELRHV